MDKLSLNPAHILDQAEEEILTDTASDEALEVAAGTETRSHSSLHVLMCCHTTRSSDE